MGPGFFGPPHNELNNPPKPKNIKELPAYLKKLMSDFFSRLFYIFRLVWETGPWILFVMIFMSVFNGVIPVIGASITANILNSLVGAFNTLTPEATLSEQLSSMLENEACRAIVFWLVIQFAFTFIKSIVSNINTILSRIYGELVVNHIKLKIMNKAKQVDLASFDTTEFYEKLENANREAGMRPVQILNSTFKIFSTLITVVSFVIVLAAVSPFAPTLIVVLAIPSAIINFIYRKKNADYIKRRSKDRRVMNYYSNIITNKDMVKELKMFALSDVFIGRYKETFTKYFKGLKRLFVAEGLWHVGLTVINAAANCALFVFIALQVCNGNEEIGNYSLYVSALNNISSGVATLISTTATIYEGTLFIDNMIVFMNNKTVIAPSLPEPRAVERRIPHVIEFKNVSFRYPNTERDVIKNVSFRIEPGETVVLVGLNGAGKTTLVKLLTRLYDPTEGEILLDGHNIKEYSVDELYRMFGIIFQDFGKYAVTVRENIAFGEITKEISDENIENAALASDAVDFINHLPNGYDTPLMRIFEENGIELSIGQWQKLSIARAFYSDSDVLILDEPTASLDPMAEQEIFNRFDELRKDKTSIFVSHRLSSATTADKILVLEYGELIESGSHRELMEAKGKYYQLFSTQAKRYIESADEINKTEPPSPRMHSDRPRGNFDKNF
ncbi:MAG: ABC transporter ATP-binding protein [Clostridia bacterium]|nr:ABC transporter ATP-binding protein [Clostridia bacterium]